jgi:16S rRNA (guanine966-N2)-methyltransferase
VTRVIAGAAGGRRLAVPPGRGTRPTADRTREGLFSTLLALRGDLVGARFLDLYAGSGAVGLEALSRGAAHVLLVEAAPPAAVVARTNAAALGLPGAQVVTGRVERVLAAPPPASGPPYDVAFLDPPYDIPTAELTAALRALTLGRWLATDALVVVERASRDGPPEWPEGLSPLRGRRYGEGSLWYGRAAAPAENR